MILLPALIFLSLLAWSAAARAPGAASDGERKHDRMAGMDEKPEVRGKMITPAAEEETEESPGGTMAGVLLVNKKRPLPVEYAPPDLRPAGIPFTCPADSPKRLLRAEAAAALERLFARAAEAGIALFGVSGYRSYERQREIFAAHLAELGEEAANRVSARPGQSEHQTGLAVDVSSPEVGGLLVESFGETEAGRWLAQNAPGYGFVIRYPRGKEDVTGYAYEPWHLRYVGTKHALAMAEGGLTLEEYLAGRAG